VIDAVLFDLDGTLLHNDMERFMRCYLQALSSRLAGYMPPQEFVRVLLAATDRMLLDANSCVTNEQAFQRAFDVLSGRSLNEIRPLLDDFYAHDFGTLAECTRREPQARSVVESVLAAGRQAVVATHPLFPRTAILQRMAWAGVDDLPFSLITSYENMHSAKPRPEYFQEIADRIGVPAGRCLMIGDDLILDQPCVRIGMRFYHVTEHEPFDPNAGTLRHLHELIQGGLLDT
jgi:HAD superfamily hydrolase (TIGR01549 family)